ncbi:hypothetical protein [Shinella sp.]|uniref:hypothetical protein n=1 Tax=Shinella sp. TaxID=1870904 RepID=UPI00258C4FB1|nr:hypothetical protein [Shinella sp.]MCW5710715.1 hypothetical protein [Shinella sp.]
MSNLVFLTLCFASASFYVLASVVMKAFGHIPFLVLLAPVAAALAAAAWFEVSLLRTGRLGHVFLFILAFEVLITAAVALVVLRESYDVRELAGLAAICIGVALVITGATPEGASSNPEVPKLSRRVQ